jgi:hypothetical protein
LVHPWRVIRVIPMAVPIHPGRVIGVMPSPIVPVIMFGVRAPKVWGSIIIVRLDVGVSYGKPCFINSHCAACEKDCD